jgi:hypothetical protein
VQVMPQRLPTRPAPIRPGQQILRTSTAGGAPLGSTTVGTAGNLAGGATGGRLDGTVTQGPAMQGDDTIRAESSPDSGVDKKVKSICNGC